MIEIINNLFIGTQDDVFNLGSNEDISLCLVAKDPFHKAIVGYSGNLDRNHQEYLIAKRTEEHLLAVNLIDVKDVSFISEKIINACTHFIHEELDKGQKVLIACNQGQSRSACIGLIYLLDIDIINASDYSTFEELEKFYLEIYPFYKPNLGMREYTINHWKKLVALKK